MSWFGTLLEGLFADRAQAVVVAPLVTEDELGKIMPRAGGRIALYFAPLNEAMHEFNIDTKPRIAAFLAQLAHESGELRYVEELASGDAYDTRTDLGNTPERDGDGRRYKGRGLIQLTGKTNYQRCSRALFRDDRLLDTPELLTEPEAACRSAAWFWWVNGLNALADTGAFETITRRVNGGLNGQTQRVAYFNRAKEALA